MFTPFSDLERNLPESKQRQLSISLNMKKAKFFHNHIILEGQDIFPTQGSNQGLLRYALLLILYLRLFFTPESYLKQKVYSTVDLYLFIQYLSKIISTFFSDMYKTWIPSSFKKYANSSKLRLSWTLGGKNPQKVFTQICFLCIKFTALKYVFIAL